MISFQVSSGLNVENQLCGALSIQNGGADRAKPDNTRLQFDIKHYTKIPRQVIIDRLLIKWNVESRNHVVH